jgi:hypothetical protein
VTRQYIAVRRAQDGVTLARRELARAEENLRLAEARVRVGAAIPLESKQAEVEQGRAEVALLQAENAVQTERLRLMQTLGMRFDGDVELTTELHHARRAVGEDELLSMAEYAHPQLRAARASESAADAGVRMARSAYLPSLSLSAGISGWARQAGNTEFLVDQQARNSMDQQQQDLHAAQPHLRPASASRCPARRQTAAASRLTPDMESRIQVETTAASRSTTRGTRSACRSRCHCRCSTASAVSGRSSRPASPGPTQLLRVRAEEMRITTEISTALHNVQTARRSAELEARNAELAGEQLRLARERYRVGPPRSSSCPTPRQSRPAPTART